jgi:hypothetical protein
MHYYHERHHWRVIGKALTYNMSEVTLMYDLFVKMATRDPDKLIVSCKLTNNDSWTFGSTINLGS